jgi:hypothetical protein
MECRISIDGDLIIDAVSETEAFALEKWKSLFETCDSSIKLIIKPFGAYWDADDDVISIYKDKKD